MVNNMDKLEIVISDLKDVDGILEENGYRLYCKSIKTAIETLKKKEAVEPFHKCGGLKYYTLIENSHYDFCPYCGRPIDWGNWEVYESE